MLPMSKYIVTQTISDFWLTK